jgi:GR25 family glycosyltransferase involved in LPS biosynthesis
MYMEKIYYINLNESTKRREHMENILRGCSIPYERFQAIRPSLEEARSTPHEPYLEGTENQLRGTIGCALSHLGVLYRIIDCNSDNYFLILEDDVSLKDNFFQVIDEIIRMNIDFDILLIDCLGKRWEPDKVPHEGLSLYKPTRNFPYYHGAYAYLVKGSRAAESVLNSLKGLQIKDIDGMFLAYCSGCLIAYPDIAYQKFMFPSDRLQ